MSFIPEVWSKEIEARLDKVLVASAITNNTWEKDIAKVGDTVNVFISGQITVTDYDPDTGLGTVQRPTNTTGQLVVNIAKAFNFRVDSIDAAQQSLDELGKYSKDAATGVKEVFDAYILSRYVEAGLSVNGGTKIEVTASNVEDLFGEAWEVLSDADVPLSDRWAVVPPKIARIINKVLGGKDTSLGDQAIQQGFVNRFQGFDIYMSTQVAVTNDGTNDLWQVMFGHRSAIAKAYKVLEIQAYKPEKFFGDAVKGLIVYGAKVFTPNKLAVLQAIKA